MFTLKVIEDDNNYFPNDKHHMGGTDVKQIYAFRHLFPSGFCDKMWEGDLLFELAEMHGWKVEVK